MLNNTPNVLQHISAVLFFFPCADGKLSLYTERQHAVNFLWFLRFCFRSLSEIQNNFMLEMRDFAWWHLVQQPVQAPKWCRLAWPWDLGKSNIFLDHNLGWSLFDWRFVYKHLLLYMVFHRGNSCLGALPRMCWVQLTCWS